MVYFKEKNGSYTYLEKLQYNNLGGNVFMSLISLSWKLSYFHINIHISKDETRKKEKAAKALQQELRIQEALERRAKLEADYHHFNHML